MPSEDYLAVYIAMGLFLGAVLVFMFYYLWRRQG